MDKLVVALTVLPILVGMGVIVWSVVDTRNQSYKEFMEEHRGEKK